MAEIDFSLIAKVVLGIGVGAIAYFLKDVLKQLKTTVETLGKIAVELAVIQTNMQNHTKEKDKQDDTIKDHDNRIRSLETDMALIKNTDGKKSETPA